MKECTSHARNNDTKRGAWSGVRYTSKNGQSPTGGIRIESLDAAMACPIMDGNPNILGGSTPMGENTQPAHIALNVTGMALSLVHNLMPISGFPQWYPFGVGSAYQKQDEASKFRFVVSFP